MMKRIAVVLPLLGACAPDIDPSSEGDEEVVVVEAPIINGTPDTTHHAVVAVLGNNSACSGTIIHVEPSNGIGHVITAAHCGTPQYVVQGNDYNSSSAIYYPVIASQNHPSYNGDVYDFKMVRFTGASSGTPVIPAMTPAQDNLTSGSQVLHVGYGKSGPAPGSNNSIRRQILGQLSGTTTLTLQYNQPNGGPCQGDSGGPQLTVGGTERVAGVTSAGDPNCSSYGFSGRVSAIHASFITPFINNAPIGPLDCNGCTEAATTGMGACMPQVNACFNNNACSALVSCYQGCSTSSCYQQCNNNHSGGVPYYEAIIDCLCTSGCASECASSAMCSSSTTSAAATGATVGATTVAGVGGGSSETGAGGAEPGEEAGPPVGDGWSAGVAAEDYEGSILTSGCTLGAPGEAEPPWWLGAAALGLVLARRRLAV